MRPSLRLLVLVLGTCALAGCYVAEPVGGPGYREGPRAAFVPGHFGPNGFWVPGHYR